MDEITNLPADLDTLLELEREIASEHSVGWYFVQYGTPSIFALAWVLWVNDPSAMVQLFAMLLFFLIAFSVQERRALRRLRLVVMVLRGRRSPKSSPMAPDGGATMRCDECWLPFSGQLKGTKT